MTLTWRKSLTNSDAQQETNGAKMPFLRFTKEKFPYDHRVWFREVFFANAPWTASVSKLGRPIEEAEVNVRVVILGEDLGIQTMRVDHDPARAENHSAPTTHLHYDLITKQALESSSLTGHSVVVSTDGDNYSLMVE